MNDYVKDYEFEEVKDRVRELEFELYELRREFDELKRRHIDDGK